MFNSPYGAAVAALVALCPGLVRLVRGRSLARLADHPELPEHLATFNRRVGLLTAACMVVLGYGAGLWIVWAFPLSVVAQWAGGFPLRKSLYQESWSLASFVSFFTRLTIGMNGFWMLVAAAPLLAATAGRFDVFAGLGLGVLMLAWAHYSSTICRAVLNVRPMTDRVVLDRFAALVATAGLPAPRFEYVEMKGGVFANAFALPSRAGASVAFTDTLLSRLAVDETVAICAHELAHLEDFTRGRLRRTRLTMFAFALASAAIAPAVRWIIGPLHIGWLFVWAVAIIVGQTLAASRWQPVETASDARAVALTGDPESLVSALTKLHAIALFPRKWDERFEQTATHPSLEQRISNIRGETVLEAAAESRPLSVLVTRMVAGLACGLALLVGQVAFAVAALVACVTPAVPLLWAAGAAGLAAAAFLLAEGNDVRGLAVLCAGLAASLFGVAWARHRATVRGSRVMFALLALGTVAVVASLAAGGVNPIRLHEAAGSTPAPAVLLVACAVACWIRYQRPVLRYAAMVSTAGALTVFGLGTTAFLEGAGRDPFLLPAASFAPVAIAPAPVMELSVPFEIDILRVSPHGRRVAVTREDDGARRSSHAPPSVFHVAGPAGTLKTIEADDLVFIDDNRVLVLVIRSGSSEIRDLDIESSLVLWRQTLPDLEEGALAFDGPLRRWTVTGSDPDDRFVRLTGVTGLPKIRRWSWSLPDREDGLTQGLATRNGSLVAVETTREKPLLNRRTWLYPLAPALMTPRFRSSVWTLRDGPPNVRARSVLSTTCEDDGLDDGLLACAAFDGTRTHLLTVDPDGGTSAAVGNIDGSFAIRDVQSDGWISGWADGEPAAVHLSARDVHHLPGEAGHAYAVTASNGYAATGAWHEGGTRIRVYVLNEGPPAGR